MATVILWAQEVVDPPDLVDSPMLGGPDRRYSGIGTSIRVQGFEGGFHGDLAVLLDGHVSGDAVGDAVTADDLARTDVIAFEGNGNSAAPSGGWESCAFTFEDGVNAMRVLWDERVASRDDPGHAPVVANGSTDMHRYDNFFDVDPELADNDHGPVMSYILFSLPTLDVTSPNFTITVTPHLVGVDGSEGTPDVDAIGVLACSRV